MAPRSKLYYLFIFLLPLPNPVSQFSPEIANWMCKAVCEVGKCGLRITYGSSIGNSISQCEQRGQIKYVGKHTTRIANLLFFSPMAV